MPMPIHKVPTEGDWNILLKMSAIVFVIVCVCLYLGFGSAMDAKLFMQKYRNGSFPLASVFGLTVAGCFAAVFLFVGLFLCLSWTVYFIQQWRLKRDYDLEPDNKAKELKRKVLTYTDSSSSKLPV